MIISLVTEGRLEEAAGQRLIEQYGHEVGQIYNLHGCENVKAKAVAYRALASDMCGVLVLTDFMDSKCACPPAAIQEYLKGKQIPESFLLRFAENELESWLLADVEHLASFLGASKAKFPKTPDVEPDPKRRLVQIARASTKKSIRDALVPSVRHGGAVGPEYTAIMQQFIMEQWDIANASGRSPSLRRCVQRLTSLA